jgi:predicted DNA-binding transcriptional regulator AlpA
MQNDISKKLAVKRALRVNDFCDAYGVCRATAYKMMKNGTLRTVLIGGRRVIPVDAAEALLREGTWPMFQTKSPPPLDGADGPGERHRRDAFAGTARNVPSLTTRPWAERAIGIAVAHLKEGAKCFREWQGLKAALAASIFSEALPW